MNKGQKPRRGRGKSSPKRGANGAAGNRVDNKSRGNPKQNVDKYSTLAHDARQQGDRNMEHYYLQFVDHFTRVMNERAANNPHPKHQKKPYGKPNGEGRGDDNGSEQTEAPQQSAKNPEQDYSAKTPRKRAPKKQDKPTGDAEPAAEAPELSEAV